MDNIAIFHVWGPISSIEMQKNVIFQVFGGFLPFSLYLSHPRVKYFLSTSQGTQGCPFGSLLGSLGPWKWPKNASNHHIFLCPPFKWVTTSNPIVKSSHSRIFPFDYSWHARSSFGSLWGPPGGFGGPWEPEGTQKMPKFIRSNNQFFHSEIPYIVIYSHI